MMRSDAGRLAALLIVAGLAPHAAAQDVSAEALCEACPDPARDIGPDNLPSKDKTGGYMWVVTDAGIDLVRNPDWSGDVPEVESLPCRRCPDPFSEMSSRNLPVSGDNQRFRWTRKGPRHIALEKNPNWRGGQPNGDDGKTTEEKDPITRAIDRNESEYHATGDGVFRRDLLENIGGVLSQGIVEVSRGGPSPAVELVLDEEGEYPGYILVHGASIASAYRIRYADLVPAALFVDSGGTSLYTLWSADKLPAAFSENAGFVSAKRGLGSVAIEFFGTRYEEALTFLDMCNSCVDIPDDVIEAEVAQYLEAVGESAAPRPESYINTDVRTSFRLEERDGGGRVAVAGTVSRFYWSPGGEEAQSVSLDRVWPIVRSDELRARAIRRLDVVLGNRALEDRHILLLMLGIDALRTLREEVGLAARRRLADAAYLFETLALLRATKLNAPERWSAFMAALSSDWLVRRHREPWELYSKTFCAVYPGVAGCG